MQPDSVVYHVTEEEVLTKYESRIRAWARRMDYSLQDDLAQAARIGLVKAWRAKGETANDAYLRATIFSAMISLMRGEYRRRRVEMDEELAPPECLRTRACDQAPPQSEPAIELDEALRGRAPLEIDIAMAAGGGYGVHDIARMFRMKTDRVRAVLKKIRGSCVQSEE